jgi:hypothetical protein
MTRQEPLGGISWMVAEPKRLARDRLEVQERFTNLVLNELPSRAAPHGSWAGQVPLWPFERPTPMGLKRLIARPLEVLIVYPSAYPMLPPRFYPLEPEPTFDERSQHRWHVAPSGRLCLLQTDGLWMPEASIVDLIEKAAGWRVEYALVKAGVVPAMSLHGIVLDDSYDYLIDQAVDSLQTTFPMDEAP